jgi:lactate dehydrogenase-like 2-hydroxyacid dehydrogenase
MNSIGVLMPLRLSDYVIEEIEKRFKLYRLWEAPDPRAYIAEVKNDIRFLATTFKCRDINGDFMGQFPNLKGVSNFGVGYDCIDAKWAASHGIIVTHTPDVLNDEVADLAMGLTLSSLRQIPQADKYARSGQWEKAPFPLSASIIGRTMGILGLGRIGKAIAKRAEAFGVKIVYHGRHKQDVPYEFYSKLEDMARDCDILMVVAPASAETKHIVNKEVLEALGPQGIVVNVARGSLIDTQALIWALENKKIWSAGIDVYENEPHIPPQLAALPNVVLTPHVASGSEYTYRAIGKLTLDNLFAMAEGKAPLTPVPEMKMG